MLPLICLSFPSNRKRTLPKTSAATTQSPALTLPDFTSTVATGPRALFRPDSSTQPSTRAFGSAARSSISACRLRCSRRLSTPSPVTPLTGTTGTSPPAPSGSTSSAMRPFSTRAIASATSTPSRSILVMATTMGMRCSTRSCKTSSVWGFTPSSAAQTTTATSVALAPLARMPVNAAWPGVSRKVTASARLPSPSPSTATLKAEMACVMPPASPAAMLSGLLPLRARPRRWSSSVVLP
mmetsp:Transcript_38583/g.120809  ORF Transcript_38583/g.120809 Transcript_38583/m.120809 type:complete len:239 (+) Transcript_38583:992-1708(+)